MASQLHGFPRGLLALLGSQNFGEAPRFLGDTVLPTVDIEDFYLLSRQVVETVNIAVLANGLNAASVLAVPPGEVWRLHHLSVFGTAGAGASADITPLLVVSGGLIAVGNTVSVGANQSRFVSANSFPRYLSSGTVIHLFSESVVGAPQGSITACVSRLRA